MCIRDRGGDEFLIILDHCNEEKAKQIIKKIKDQLHTELLYDQQKDRYMYLNFGMAYQEHFDGTDECINEMYAKEMCIRDRCIRERGYRYPVDLYFEGSDQYRGWFNSSLILSLIHI